MAFIATIETGFPPYYYDQETLIRAFRKYWEKGYFNPERIERFHRNVMVGGRYLAQPIERYTQFSGFAETNSAWIEAALEVGEKTVRGLLDQASLTPEQVSFFALTTVTGIAVPSIDARLMNRIPFAPDLKRLPIFGLGCLGGVAGISRVFDYLKGHPGEAAILLSIELCSLTLQREDLSIANIVSSGLFGDGAAAVLMVGVKHPLARSGLPQVIDSRSVFFPNTERVMGWDIVDSGFKVVLSPDVPDFAGDKLCAAVDAFLSKHHLTRKDISEWIAHPGGPKVIDAMEAGLKLPAKTLDLGRESLRQIGNLSSASVLFVLKDTLTQHEPKPGGFGMLVAMGPAFCAEMVLLKW